MDKKVLHIWFDGEIKATIEPDNLSVPETELKKILQQLKGEKYLRRSGVINKNGKAIFNYQNFEVKMDNILKLTEVEFINDFLSITLAKFELQRIKQLKEHTKKQTVKEVKKEVDVDDYFADEYKNIGANGVSISVKDFEKNLLGGTQPKKEEPKSLEVSRKNKYSRSQKIIAGTIVFTLLATGTYAVNHTKADSGKVYDDVPDVEQSEEIVSNEDVTMDDFEIAMDINEVVNSNNTDTKLGETGNIYLSYEDESDSLKAVSTQSKYGELIEICARKCGLDPRLVLGIATQESGDHELGLRAGSRGGLMQIELSFWDGKELEYYDFDDKEAYILKVTKESLQDVENNILIGCAILQNELKTYNYNILLATLSYNQGYSNINKILDKTSRNTGLSKLQLINDHNCLDWLNYTNESGVGDSNYINNVLRYTGFGYKFYEFNCKKENGELVTAVTGPVISENQKVI